MTYALLRYDDPSLPPEGRWFLWQWGHVFGLDAAVSLSVRELLKELGMTSRHGQYALNKLKGQGEIIATSKPTGRGRPSYEYRLSPTFLKRLATYPDDEPVLAEDINRLGNSEHVNDEAAEQNVDADHDASLGNLLDGQTRQVRLSLANRWVLMVLLAHANENGTVMEMPGIRLQRLTGLSSNRWLSQRHKLHTLGVLPRYQRGRPGHWKGLTLPMIHYLNLSHPCLHRPSQPAIQVELLPRNTIDPDTSMTEAAVTALLKAAETHATQPEQFERAMQLQHFREFSAAVWAVVGTLPNTYEVMAWLRAHVHEATTKLLNTAWEELKTDKLTAETPIETVVKGLEHALDHPLIAMGAKAMRENNDGGNALATSSNDSASQAIPSEQDADYKAIWVKVLYDLAHRLAKTRQFDLPYEYDGAQTSMPDPSRLTYELIAVTSPGTSETNWRDIRFWRLCGYWSRCDEPTTAPPVVKLIWDGPVLPKTPSPQPATPASKALSPALSATEVSPDSKGQRSEPVKVKRKGSTYGHNRSTKTRKKSD